MSDEPPLRSRKQRGVLIVALMAGIAIMLILSTVAVQAWADIARRDNEAEMIFRAEDIVRALKRFQTDKGKLPAEFKELMEPGQKGQYFLRQLWKDPLVKGGKWQFVYASPAGGIFDPSVATGPQTGAPPQSDAPFQTNLPPQARQAKSGANPDESAAFPPIGKKDDGSTEGTGLPIAGVKTRCTDRPFRLYRDKAEYSEWVFSIFDLTPNAPGVNQQQNPPGGSPAPSPAPN
jgi:type II secretory pathway pseudopilin PulG